MSNGDLINFKAGYDLKARLWAAASRRGINLSGMLRMIIIDWLDRNERDAA